VDCIVVTRIDRLSRSLLDFARIVDVLDRHGVSFVAVTQQFDTSTPMGKLTLNVLLSFAQFEREMIAERTREKMVAARRKGKYTGGPPPLGYDAEDGRLVVNRDEAVRVRAIFDLYLKHESLTATLAEMAERHWTTKSWTTRRGYHRKGKSFQKASLRRLLTNPIHVGKIAYQRETYDGEHEGIVDPEIWERTQQILKRNRSNGGRGVHNRYGALLKGILRCAPCDAAMVHSLTKKGGRRYRYYVCGQAQRRGWASCPTKSIPAGEIEQAIYEHIRAVGRDPVLVQETIAAARKQLADQRERLEADVNVTERRLARLREERQALLETISQGGSVAARAAERLDQVAGEIDSETSHVSALRRQVADLSAQEIDEKDFTTVLGQLDPIWDVLVPRERTRIIHLLIKLVDFDGEKIGITFHPSGIKTLVENG
jgi:site-specific DNA recombinase